jgi:mannose-1-phosphate guanylyltransferase/mannose-6-phosphate isomerase
MTVLGAPAASRLVPVILAGGSGTRLWPVSRAAFPKHLVELFGEESLLQTTVRRALAVAPAGRVVTVTAAGQAVLVRRQLEALDGALVGHVLAEPSPRNTAAAIALAALHARAAFGPESVLWVCPSDHVMLDTPALYAALDAGLPAADQGWLVTFGIAPSRPETGFGWIASDGPVAGLAGVERVRRFVEKPARDAAERMLAEGGYAWNSGMFLMRADAALASWSGTSRSSPPRRASPYAAFAADGGRRIDAGLYAAVKSMPVDKAVMERSSRVAVVPVDPKWSDVGSWHALWEMMDKDAAGNAVQAGGDGSVILVDARGCLVRSEKRLVALAGVEDLAVVETADAVLVARREVGEAIRGVVDVLAKVGRKEATVHAREVRPWGTFLVLQEGPGYKVKEVCVDAGRRLTRQYHPGRDEHWTVVAGSAEVELGGRGDPASRRASRCGSRGAGGTGWATGTATLRLIETGIGEALGDDGHGAAGRRLMRSRPRRTGRLRSRRALGHEGWQPRVRLGARSRPTGKCRAGRRISARLARAVSAARRAAGSGSRPAATFARPCCFCWGRVSSPPVARPGPDGARDRPRGAVAGGPVRRGGPGGRQRRAGRVRQRPPRLRRAAARDQPGAAGHHHAQRAPGCRRGGRVPGDAAQHRRRFARTAPQASACLLFATSHGVPREGLVLTRRRELLTPAYLDRTLRRHCAGKPTVAIVSGCFSGIFADAPMPADDRIVLTAASRDRPSFGCSNDLTYTYFDDALLRLLPEASTWDRLYEDLRAAISARERALDVPPSRPQASFGVAVRKGELLDG